MQKVINVLSITSFVISISLIGTGTFIYANRDSIANSIKKELINEVTNFTDNTIKKRISNSPPIPNTTGPVVPAVGLGIPQF